MADDFADDVKQRFKNPFGSSGFSSKDTFPVDPGCSHRPDKRAPSGKAEQSASSSKKAKNDDTREERKRTTRSKQFLSSLSKAKHEPFALKNKPKSKISRKTVFKVYSINSGKVYDVKVDKSPSCTYYYFAANDRNRRQVCKHMIWVYLYVLKVPVSNDVIQQIALTDAEVETIFGYGNQFAPPNVFHKKSSASV